MKKNLLWWKSMGSMLLVALALCLTQAAYAQTATVTGKVVDADNQEPIIGALVKVVGTATVVSTDVDGAFSVSAASSATLEIKFLGYTTQQVAVNGRSNVGTITLAPDAQELEQVVITGYGGTQNRATMTNSVSKLDTKALENRVMSNVGTALQGNIPGLAVTNYSGKPGTAPTIVLRGGATITGDNNAALVIVDGVVRSMDGLNPADIESMDVLKDAASTAIYGARANGGVILITTKSGKQGRAQVSYNFKSGWNFARTGYNFVGAEDYLYYNRLGAKYTYEDALLGGTTGNSRTLFNVDGSNGYGTTQSWFDTKYLAGNEALYAQGGWQKMTDPYSGKELIYKDYQGQITDAAFNNPSFTQDHHLSLSGGNDKGTFLASFGYYNEDGQVKNTKFERFTGAVNGSYKIRDNFKVTGSADFSLNKAPNMWLGEAQLFYRSMSLWPTWNPWLEDGSPASGVSSADGNPLYWSDKLLRDNQTTRTTFALGINWNIIPQLTLAANASIYYFSNVQQDFDKETKTQNSATSNTVRNARAYHRNEFQQQYNATLTYKNTWADKHNFDAMVGGEILFWDRFISEAKSKLAPTDEIPTLNAGSEANGVPSSEKTANGLMSVFGRINYNYEQKYLFSAVARVDGTSKLSDNRWGFFPGVSAGWNLHNESWYRDSKMADVVSMIKPRVSYGVNGNIAGLTDFEVFGLYGVQTAYNGAKGYLNTGLVNGGLRWERSTALEVGLDLALFSNRLMLSVNYYNRVTSDLLTNLALPGYTGFSTYRTNLGTLQNQGFEAELRYSIFRNPEGWSWDVSANVATVANKILQLPTNGNENNRQGGYQVWDQSQQKAVWVGGYQEGRILGEMVAYKFDGLYRTQAELNAAGNLYDQIGVLYGPTAWANLANKKGAQPISLGDARWADLNGDNKITELDREVVGNIFPNVTGGFATNVSYKWLSLSARFDFALGHTIYNDLIARSLGQYQGNFNVIDLVKDSWSPDNINAKYPKFYYADQQAKKNYTRSNNANPVANNNSSQLYEKGDYLCLREVTLNFTLPKRWMEAIKMQNINVYVTGQNLIYFTQYSGTNPEPVVSTAGGAVPGVDQGRYPIPRTVVLGLNLTF